MLWIHCFSSFIYLSPIFCRLFVILDADFVGYMDAAADVPPPAPVVQQQQQQAAPAAQYGSYGGQQSYGAPAPASYAAPAQAAPTSYGAPAGGYGSTKPMPSTGGYGAGTAASNHRPIMKDDSAGGTIMPISAINPYSSR